MMKDSEIGSMEMVEEEKDDEDGTMENKVSSPIRREENSINGTDDLSKGLGKHRAGTQRVGMRSFEAPLLKNEETVEEYSFA